MDSQLGKCLYLTDLWESLCCIFLIHYRCGRKQLPVGRVMPGMVVLGAVRRQPTQTSEQANKQPSHSSASVPASSFLASLYSAMDL